MEFCRCDNPTFTDNVCDVCKLPPREISTELLHRPPTITTFAPAWTHEEKRPWRVCPSCGAENTEHKPTCPKANWNVNKYTPPKQLETDEGYRVRLIGDIDRMSDLDRSAVLTATGKSLDSIGWHYGFIRGITGPED